MRRLEYEVHTPRHIVEPAKIWCEAEWGPQWSVTENRTGAWSVFWGGPPGRYRWIFATEQQAVLFTLRWS